MGGEVEVTRNPIDLELSNHPASSLIVKLLSNVNCDLVMGHSTVIVYLTARYDMSRKTLPDIDVVHPQYILNVD